MRPILFVCYYFLLPKIHRIDTMQRMKRIIPFLTAVLFASSVFAAPPINPRGGSDVAATRPVSAQTSARTATATPERATTARSAIEATVPNIRTVTTQARVARNAATAPVTAPGINRSRAASSAPAGITAARSGATPMVRDAANISRAAAGAARAPTALFTDMSRMGAGYSACREGFSTCMDQFCGAANDTFRRCICSDRFKEFSATEANLDRARIALQDFVDNELNVVELSAAEATAMYTATAGERVLKRGDVSEASRKLDEITNMLSGNAPVAAQSRGLGLLGDDIRFALDDIWADTNMQSADRMVGLEGVALYNEVNRQCTDMTRTVCEDQNTMTMVRSAYGIMITNDCNAHEKKVNANRELVMQKVREVTNLLRQARLQEYRDHNSADFNACLTNVRAAMLSDAACGAGWRRCLDFTGSYVSPTTGEPILTPNFFRLGDQLNLSGNAVMGNMSAPGTQVFLRELDARRNRAQPALDSCRDDANAVWNAFREQAIIEIAQAQDRLIQEVKDSCITTISECYDRQTGAMNSFGEDTAVATGAIAARATKAVCAERVAACASLYCTPGMRCDTCTWDAQGRFTNADTCGATMLISFMNAVDTNRIQTGCRAAMEAYSQDFCRAATGDARGWPWGCRLRTSVEIRTAMNAYAQTACLVPGEAMDAGTSAIIDEIMRNINEGLDYQMGEACTELSGAWMDASRVSGDDREVSAFATMFGGRPQAWGVCVENSARIQCEIMADASADSGARWDASAQQCVLSENWYRNRCEGWLNGYYLNGICHVL